MEYYLAIDLGASSGRHIVSFKKGDKVFLNEVYRFKTLMYDSIDGLVWDIPRILNEIKIGIKKAFEQYKEIESLAIDSWGVDYVLMNKDKEIPPYYAYRNERCKKAANEVHNVVSFKDIYAKSGIQFAAFNTLYQLYDDFKRGRLENATDYLMIPSYFTYKLTGVKTHEYTDESTGALLDANSGEYNFELLNKLGLPRKLFNVIKHPGDYVGELLPEIQKEVGGNCKVIVCASHDTASAFESINVRKDDIILSSGTWSLLGIKSKKPIISKEGLKANYTNEGGVGYIRFLKNIMGMYLANKVRTELNLTSQDIDPKLPLSTYKETFDVNDPSLNAPKSMKEAICKLLKGAPPKDDVDIFASIYHSQALCYKKSIEELEKITKKKFKNIYVLGGGAKNKFLNNLIEEYTHKKVIAKPIESTALGNIKIQMKVGEKI